MKTIFVPGTPAPSDSLVKAASVLDEIEWRAHLGFDYADLEEEFADLIERYTVEAVWARRKDLCGND